jgi:ribosomal-protein-alanine N-acetyltransferase
MLTENDGRVAIIATTAALLDAEEQGTPDLVRALGVREPPEWPPEFNGPEYRQWQRNLFAAHPDEPGYAGWYVIGAGELVGTAGYKGPPNPTGIVEVGYSIIPPRRRRGFASAAVRLLIRRAFADPRVTALVGETLPSLAASQGVLRACGFTVEGSRIDPEDGEVLRFVLSR